jgi:chemotaxis signal transduction protein
LTATTKIQALIFVSVRIGKFRILINLCDFFMDKNEYLIARVGHIKLGVFCRDVENVYSEKIKLVKLFYQGDIFRGLTSINGNVMQVLDLRRRIGLEQRAKGEQLTLISFNTGGANSIAVVVDEIIGMRRVDASCIQKNDRLYSNRSFNVGLLFPTVAVLELAKGHASDELIHLLDSTYLDKTEPIVEESGELELF